jgi:hypothetical protein
MEENIIVATIVINIIQTLQIANETIKQQQEVIAILLELLSKTKNN